MLPLLGHVWGSYDTPVSGVECKTRVLQSLRWRSVVTVEIGFLSKMGRSRESRTSEKSLWEWVTPTIPTPPRNVSSYPFTQRTKVEPLHFPKNLLPSHKFLKTRHPFEGYRCYREITTYNNIISFSPFHIDDEPRPIIYSWHLVP